MENIRKEAILVAMNNVELYGCVGIAVFRRKGLLR